MSKVDKGLGVVFGICLFVVILYYSIALPTFSVKYYEKSYIKNNVSDTINVNEENLKKVTKVLIDYIKDKNDSLYVEAVVDGKTREFYNQREKDHMIDVKEFFLQGKMVKSLFLIILILSIAYVFYKYKKIPYNFLNISAKTMGFLIMGIIIFAGVFLMNFDKNFIIFHKLSFDNDLWILTPNVDLLINLVPTQFFIDIFVTVAVLVFTKTILYIGIVNLLKGKLDN